MRFKAVFFDRDGTLTYYSPDKVKYRDDMISSWSGKPFELPYEKMMDLFRLASYGKTPWYRDLEDERDFFRRFYRHLLAGEGVDHDLDRRAEMLFSELWCNGDRIVYPETVEVLEYCRMHGYKIGVISDTSPSLEYTLQQLGIAEYFTSFTASSLVGAGKPSPIIFHAALDAQGVTAEESLYVDDCRPEADGARELGFTSLWLDRSGETSDVWVIRDLTEIIGFLESRGR